MAVQSSIITRDIEKIAAQTGNLYESVVVISKRARQIAVNIKEELNNKLAEFATTVDNLEEVCPDTEDYEDAEYALNACGAVNALLLQVAEPDEWEHFVEIAMSYYDTVDANLQDESDEELDDEAIDEHPMLAEARRFLLQS